MVSRAIPPAAAAFGAWLEQELCPRGNPGVTVRSVAAGGGPITVVFVEGLCDPEAVTARVMRPLAGGLPDRDPAVLAAAAVFPAPAMQVVTTTGAVLAGLTALHLDGFAAALLVATRAADPGQGSELTFDLTGNIARVRRAVGTPALRVQVLAPVTETNGPVSALLYRGSCFSWRDHTLCRGLPPAGPPRGGASPAGSRDGHGPDPLQCCIGAGVGPELVWPLRFCTDPGVAAAAGGAGVVAAGASAPEGGPCASGFSTC